MGYDYTILYKKGKDNIAANALSRCPATLVQLQMLTTITSDFLSEGPVVIHRGFSDITSANSTTNRSFI